MGWYAVFRREMKLLWKKVGKMGYVFSFLVSPFIYLFAFGLGLGGRVNVDGGYLPFLAAGIIGVTVMLNAYQQTASSISSGKYFRHFQNIIVSPIPVGQVIFGIILAGVVRSLLFGALVFLVALLAFSVIGLNSMPAVAGVILGALCFSSLGVVVGMLVNNPDDISIVNNFFITPMTFFGGSFFPLHNLPVWLAAIMKLTPIASLNTMLRAASWQGDVWWAAGVMTGLTCIFYGWGVWLYTRYSE
ncbi:MAG TPA: ABC transporter permease [Methylomusa anaerophila]|uniref:Transport permease protein n=1 Tax=Methylomusa anaerophila TaxID=1930071 RepID=A0A348AEA2_9FIRM|nr:ABC transporter permease [Methylomusa anaerophila]BBB89400.1 inner membrane transport permease YadH [Methylomusa anaerophila]HML90477.1 ABC transporter permease [Methylomusa anaerophila]